MESAKLRILAVGAHPDDCEECFGGTTTKYMRLGHVVKFVSMTNGNAGHQTMGRAELAAVRLEETRKVAALTGVEYEVLNNNDGGLIADLATRDELIAVIRRFRPDLLLTHRANDYHTDHRNTALLVQDTSYLLMVPLVCPDVPCLREMPVIMSFFDDFRKPVEFTADVSVDIDDVMDAKVNMLDCHRSQYYSWLPWVEHEEAQLPESPEDRLSWLGEKTRARDAAIARKCRARLTDRYGMARGGAVRYAEAFETNEYGAPLTEALANKLFPF